MNNCLLVHSGNMVVMALLSLLHLSHSANEAERIVYMFHGNLMFYKKPCSHDAISRGGGGGQFNFICTEVCGHRIGKLTHPQTKTGPNTDPFSDYLQ